MEAFRISSFVPSAPGGFSELLQPLLDGQTWLASLFKDMDTRHEPFLMEMQEAACADDVGLALGRISHSKTISEIYPRAQELCGLTSKFKKTAFVVSNDSCIQFKLGHEYG